MLDSRAEAFQNGGRLTEATDSQPGEALVGTVLAGRYRIERLLGAGGMGAVYRAEHVLMRKACAVKVLHREMTQVKEVVARFEREAVAAARIEHPNVAAATDFGQLDNGSFYLVLEFIEGKSLNQLIHDSGGGCTAGQANAANGATISALQPSVPATAASGGTSANQRRVNCAAKP